MQPITDLARTQDATRPELLLVYPEELDPATLWAEYHAWLATQDKTEE